MWHRARYKCYAGIFRSCTRAHATCAKDECDDQDQKPNGLFHLRLLVLNGYFSFYELDSMVDVQLHVPSRHTSLQQRYSTRLVRRAWLMQKALVLLRRSPP